MTLPHPAPLSGASWSAAELALDDTEVVLLDQRRLPEKEEYLRLGRWQDVAEAIRNLTVRGAPAIGITAAYAMVLAARDDPALPALERAGAGLEATRPTAVNLAWAVRRQLAVARDAPEADRTALLARHARALHEADVAANRRMGALLAAELPEGAVVLTHCNAGALATGGYGTALGVVRALRDQGKRPRVLADETRPVLQGARLTAWELQRDGIPVEVITDGMAAVYLGRGEVSLVVVGADRIAANGDVANKVGTYGLACLARHHGVPFWVAAPWSTVDLATGTGASIPIEERAPEEVMEWGGHRTVPRGVGVRNPAFDVTPASLVTGIATERGLLRGDLAAALRAAWEPPGHATATRT